MKASSGLIGHREDLAPSMAAKMSRAFGMDLSQVKLYRSNAMEGTEAEGFASGNRIILSADIDLNTMAGQEVLGHELSHIRAQSMGIGMGNTGLYRNDALEQKADSEGMLAARGQSILGDSTGMNMGQGMSSISGFTPLGSGMNASAGAPMQAKLNKKKPEPTVASEAARLRKQESSLREKGKNPTAVFKRGKKHHEGTNFLDSKKNRTVPQTLDEHGKECVATEKEYIDRLYDRLISRYGYLPEEISDYEIIEQHNLEKPENNKDQEKKHKKKIDKMKKVAKAKHVKMSDARREEIAAKYAAGGDQKKYVDPVKRKLKNMMQNDRITKKGGAPLSSITEQETKSLGYIEGNIWDQFNDM